MCRLFSIRLNVFRRLIITIFTQIYLLRPLVCQKASIQIMAEETYDKKQFKNSNTVYKNRYLSVCCLHQLRPFMIIECKIVVLRGLPSISIFMTTFKYTNIPENIKKVPFNFVLLSPELSKTRQAKLKLILKQNYVKRPRLFSITL